MQADSSFEQRPSGYWCHRAIPTRLFCVPKKPPEWLDKPLADLYGRTKGETAYAVKRDIRETLGIE